MKKNTEKIKWLAAGFLVAHIFLFCVMFRSPKKRWEQDSYDCAIVCGCRVKEDGVPSDTLKARVEKAVELWKEKKVKYLIMSGAAVQSDFVEAEAMKRYAVSTYHNLLYSCRMMRNCNFQDCVVVTSGWHLRKADHYTRQKGVPYVMAAAANPKKQKPLEILWLHVRTNLHMYMNMWKGYY